MKPTGHLRIAYMVNPQTGDRINVLQQWVAYENDKVADSYPAFAETGMWIDVPTVAVPWPAPSRGGQTGNEEDTCTKRS